MSSRNTGLMSLNEVFAMKKNLAHQAKFEHKLTTMKKDFYHRRGSMQQAIKSTVHTLKDIQSSTGYSLEEDEKVRAGRRVSRKSVVYLAPIGMKLMKKYIGPDMKMLPRFLSTLPNLSNQSEEMTNLKKTVKSVQFGADKAKDTGKSLANDVQVGNRENPTQVEPLLPQIIVTEPKSEDSLHEADGNCIESKELGSDAEDDVFENSINSTLEVTVRRSSRSTFRTRTTARFYSHPSILEEHNINVISMPRSKQGKSKSTTDIETDLHSEHKIPTEMQYSSKGFKGNKLSSDSQSNLVKFCLDYGDGTLHDTLKIPKLKDCSRPWCNPFCKTCQLRSSSRPCFVLIPYVGKEPPRKIANKRRSSIFPLYQSGKPSDADSIDGSDDMNCDDERKTDVNSKVIAKVGKANQQVCDSVQSMAEEPDKDPANISGSVLDGGLAGTSDPNNKTLKKVEPLRGFKLKKGYSKRRMEELSQPRGGHPAEVRFSKASLRRRKEEMKETERTKELSWHERQNLSFIQGKISHFLAMLNEKKAMLKPTKLPDIPIREVIDSDKLIHEAKKRKKIKRYQALKHREFS